MGVVVFSPDNAFVRQGESEPELGGKTGWWEFCLMKGPKGSKNGLSRDAYRCRVWVLAEVVGTGSGGVGRA
ncbi:hypothetical protein [Streptosporangium sp. NPDC049376]|uniref:hypothetical protein n=1 Tax=Streptosporangium sp. NPDC049376 TaxID=3366192 RepID=UPI00379C033A